MADNIHPKLGKTIEMKSANKKMGQIEKEWDKEARMRGRGQYKGMKATKLPDNIKIWLYDIIQEQNKEMKKTEVTLGHD